MNCVASLVQILLVAVLHLSNVKVSLPLSLLNARQLLMIRQGHLLSHTRAYETAYSVTPYFKEVLRTNSLLKDE